MSKLKFIVSSLIWWLIEINDGTIENKFYFIPAFKLSLIWVWLTYYKDKKFNSYSSCNMKMCNNEIIKSRNLNLWIF